MSEKEKYLEAWDAEFRQTMEVLNAYPVDKTDFKPHDKLRTTKEVAWRVVTQEQVLDQAIAGNVTAAPLQPVPESFQELKNIYEHFHGELFLKMKNLPEPEYDKTIRFHFSPVQAVECRRLDVFKLMLLDMARHRGQLSVYLKMTTGAELAGSGTVSDKPSV